ncbi:hypothetical protein [Bacillus pseudomycoides]|nr:hypothetical protein [Bacillus pseudomycoides]
MKKGDGGEGVYKGDGEVRRVGVRVGEGMVVGEMWVEEKGGGGKGGKV